MSLANRGGLSGLGRGVRTALLLALGAMLSSCGGGGGGGGGGSAYTISSSSVTFNATQGGVTPSAQAVNVNVLSGTVFILTTQSGTQFTHFFGITGPTTGQITITPAQPTNAGTFTGSITVRGCSTINCSGADVAGSPKVINVTYTVAPAPALTSTPASIDFVTNTGVTPAAKTLNLSLTTGGSAGWTSTITHTGGAQNWLNVAPNADGILPRQVTVSVSPVPAAGVHTANITFTAGFLTKVVPVTLTVNDPRANFVSPYVATTGVGGNVIIRGFGFAGLNAVNLQVKFGANAATAPTVISDTEIHATHPGLAAGNYLIEVGDGTLTLPSRTQLKLAVVNAPAFPLASIVRQNNPGGLGSLIYDAERQSIYLLDAERNRVEAYRFDAGNWITDTPLSVGGGFQNFRMALSPDGTELLKTTGSTLWRISPAAPLAVISSVDALPFLGAGGHLNMIAFGNDGGAIGNAFVTNANGRLYRYDMLTQQFATLSTSFAPSTQFDFLNRIIVASGDGDTLVLPTFESVIQQFAKAVITYDASSGILSQTAVLTSNTHHASLSRTGSRMLLTRATTDNLNTGQVTTVYDTSLTALGKLPDGATAFVISPDGATAFAYYSSGNGITGTVRRFNLAVPPVGGVFPEVGVGTIVDSPGIFIPEMTISPDGGTLFLASDQRLIILPAPQ